MNSDTKPYDLLVIGGGINGTGIARDAVGRGLKVLLLEQGDLAQATSSASTKLIHGGLRYLEYYEFRLVREALIEREVLLHSAPHIIKPLRFILPHDQNLRPAWLIRLGLFLYDHLGGRKKLPGTETVHRADGKLDALQARFRRGFAYSDCWVDDARLVVLNAMDAKARGADIKTRHRFLGAHRKNGMWQARFEDHQGQIHEVEVRAIVNAAGPWVGQVVDKELNLPRNGQLRLVKGSHIIVPRLFEGDYAYILQNKDQRIVFAIPYEHRFTLIGTTDIVFEGDPSKVQISSEETEYLCNLMNNYMKKQIKPSDVVRSYAGVRPLYDDNKNANASAVTRDYVLDLGDEAGQAPLLNIYGGKITTYRKLAEHAMEKLSKYFPSLPGSWTESAVLPGGDIANGDMESFLQVQYQRYPWLAPETLGRMARAYGTRMDRILVGATKKEDLGQQMSGDLYEAEIRYMIQEEWARTPEDVLWRRSKLGLHLPSGVKDKLESYFATANFTTAKVG